ncbi:uncharacterized protein E0L32_003992 [Thyridium curvatum]|uniref:Non-homologous end-joining factor 1 n=1 Tax=Thyridium curvatum TaxID=1093900 RepID=A0A507B9Q6_9PEZI|nr:uncharacterized protein E0L32_003992 [Thyridium curvatum]TPX16343.1 hypothetical protein E0L32_003992 [Thyridium curvatum]
MSGPSWHPLPVAHHDIPTLLVSTSFTQSSYTVHITDMANIWSESLERKAICMRGFKEDTSIDPSEDSEQMGLFLGKIRATFEQDAPDHESTSLAVAGSADGDLVLRITCVLPKPLKPLKWPVYLKKSPGSAIATELVLPLIQAHHTRVEETDSLVSLLKEKDAVIAKLLDKHESMGTGLENIFTALSSKRKVTRAAAEDRIKGLAPFRESELRVRLERAHGGDSVDVKGLIQEAFGGKGLRYRSDLDIAASADLDTWWKNLDSGAGVQLVERKKEKSPAAAEAAPPTPTKPADDDDDFQVQATPPHLMSAKKREAGNKRAVPGDDDGTTDDEAAIPDSNPPPKPSSPAPKKSKLGAIGKKKQATPPPPPPKSPSPAPEEPAAEDVAMDDAASATASEHDANPESSPPPPPPPKSSQPKKGGLGRIGGGKAKAAEKTKSKSPSPELPPASQSTSKPAPKKLGQIGKKKETAPAGEPARGGEESSRGRGRTPAGDGAKEEKPRETSEERANRKREELEKELQRKAAAGPAKKKRKF